MNILARDPNNQLPYVYQTFYALPGVTEVIIDPLAEENVVVVPPTGNILDAKAAQSADSMYDLWFPLATGGKDKLGDGEITVCPQEIAESGDFTPLRTLLEQIK